MSRPADKGRKGLVTYVTNQHSGKVYTVSTVRMGPIGESRVYRAGRGRLRFLTALSRLRQRYLERDLADGGSLEELHARVARMVSVDDPDRWEMSLDLQMALAQSETPPFVSRSRQADEFRARDEKKRRQSRAGDDDKRDRLAADRLRALRRHDLISADGRSWWNSDKWEPIGLSLNYQISSAEEMQLRRHDHGIEGVLEGFLSLPEKLPEPPSAEEAEKGVEHFYRAIEKSRQEQQRLAQKPAPTLQEAERLIEAERRQRMAQESDQTQ